MSGPGEKGSAGDGVPDDAGVLANLPRARPQRSSARRTAARERRSRSAPTAAQSKAAENLADALAIAPKPATKPPAAPRSRPKAKAPATDRSRPSRPAKARPRPPARETVPLQGFESEGERASGPVQPPGGAEFVASAAELVGELAKASFTTGERLLRDMFSLLPRS